jgi:hypothetical protein
MGQVLRRMSYDHAANEKNAIPALSFLDQTLKWFRLDDGVMGGRSKTEHSEEKNGLHFAGTINTNGGGFCSVRATIPSGLPSETEGIRLRYRGDGKTYKILLSDGHTGGLGSSPSWQYDIPTENRKEGSELEEKVIVLDNLHATFMGGGSGKTAEEDHTKFHFDPTKMTQIGLMLSMKLSDGSANPKETYGEGVFPFSLFVESIEAVMAKKK